MRVYSKARGLRNLKAEVSIESYRVKYPDAVVINAKIPSNAQMERWISNCEAKSLDGCIVEPDGECEHGLPSWIIALGMV